LSSKLYFDEVARHWDTMRANFFSEKTREKALAIARLQKGKIAADIGAGTGFITEGLIHRGLQVIAVDQSEEMLETMRKKFSSVKNIDYRLGEAENLPVSDNSVDYVFANMYLHHVESPSQAIIEMVRILKPGGILVITDLDEHHYEYLRVEQHDRWMGFKRKDVRQWLTEASLQKITVDCIDEACCNQSNCGSYFSGISIFVATGEK